MKIDLDNKFKTKLGIALTNYGIEQFIVAGFMSCIASLGICVGLHSLGLSFLITVVIALPIIIVGIVILVKQLPAELKGIRKQKPWLTRIWLLMAIAAFLLTARLSIFMIDHTQTQHSIFPGDKWQVEHCCLTAYSESARMVSIEENIYKPQHYYDRKISIFNVDLYHYPPPFLLFPLAAQIIVGGDFLKLRAFWFAMSLLTFILAMSLLTYRLDQAGRMRAIGMAPLICCSLPFLIGLQMSNVQIIVISISIIAMAVFPKHIITGSILLAMSIAAKIFPGILIVFLLAQRKYRESAYTIFFAIVLSVLAFIIIGPTPFRAFIEYEIPRLSSGDAFSRPFSKMFAVARNMSPFGIPLKLEGLGVPGMSLEIGRIVSTIYLLGVLGLAVISGRRQTHKNTETVSIWISLLSLGSLLSPFAPANYVLVPVIILVCINRETFSPLAAVIILLLISVPFLLSREAPFLFQVLCYLPAQIISVGVPGFILWRSGFRSARHKKEILATAIAR